MKLHIITVGKPRLQYAQKGWAEYFERLKHYHQVRVTHLPDKKDSAAHILKVAGNAFKVILEIGGQAMRSKELANFLDKQALTGREVCFIIGGPTGLPTEVRDQADYQWSLSQLTFPHDLAMIMLLEALYRASTINAGHPYHK